MFRKLITPSVNRFVVIYGMLFFFSAAVSLTVYIDSSFLSQALNQLSGISGTSGDVSTHATHERVIGLIYAIASFITLIVLAYAPSILKQLGNIRLTGSLVGISLLSLIGLGTLDNPLIIISLFITQSIIISTLYFNFDIFLEEFSKKDSIGMVRGIALTIGGIAWLFPPALAGEIASRFSLSYVYLLSALFIVPIIFLLFVRLRTFPDPSYNHPSLWVTLQNIIKQKDIRGILVISTLLQFFYALMVIYTPLYLKEHLGLDWETMGLALTFALTAFIIYEVPVGYIADRWLGEKELLILGFGLMGLGSILIPLVSLKTLGIWALVLFIGRSGASIVETMAETYFFKKIGVREAHLMSAFRRTRPFAFLLAPLIAAIFLQFFPLRFLFYFLATLMLWGVSIAARLVDTK